ncbi:uncharacterized protein LOC116348903 [Contarinia nasturtii]|uniref:uncharacterized protein LOC116348903 n=1 Tax=Contarinia nasturtii TaxID=265458 RepID=UPI0012D3A008|nr:uncharacterized protein LOC116348903 [Contarinia nasturtii]
MNEPMADAQFQDNQTSEIFKLNGDCFEAVAEWLCLADLHALGQTCKRLQKVAGYIFKETYPAARIQCQRDGIYFGDIQVNGFCDYIHNMAIKTDDLNCFRFVDSNNFTLIKRIQINKIKLTDEKIGCIKKILNNAEIVEVIECTLNDEFYANFLHFCSKMTGLSVRTSDANSEATYFYYHSETQSSESSDAENIFEEEIPVNVLIGTNNDWLLRKYPMLERFELTKTGFPFENLPLKAFFKQNSNIRHFAVSMNGDWSGTDNLKLDVFAIDCDDYDTESLEVAGTMEYLSKMTEDKRFYERLHVYGYGITAEWHLEWMISMSEIEKLYLHDTWIRSFVMNDLKEIRIRCGAGILTSGVDMVGMVNGLANIEQVSLVNASVLDILAFIRGSVKLHKLRIENFNPTELSTNGTIVLDLSMWNNEREPLERARKVTVYVEEKIFLATKWATRTTDYSLVDLKRDESHDWSHDFGFL